MATASPTLRKERPAPTPAPPPPSFLRRNGLPLLVAALCNVPAIARVQYVPALLSVAGIAFMLMRAGSLRQAFWTGFLYIMASGLLLNYWLLPVLTRYTGGNVLVAFLCYIASSALLAPVFGLQFAFFAWLRRRGPAAPSMPGVLRDGALFAAVWVLFEWARAAFFSAVPWMGYAWGSALARNTLLLQPAAFGGVFLLSFLLVFTAWMLAAAVTARRARLALPAGALLLLQLLTGYIVYERESASGEGAPSFRAALIAPALSTDLVWNPENANVLVRRLLGLNRQALALHPDLAVWTEATVPWTYRADDDFVKEVLRATAGTNTHSLLGMTSDGTGPNAAQTTSIYLLNPAGTVLGRYDKQELLAGAERPLLGGIPLPFASGGNTSFHPGLGAPVPSPWGKGGLLLCNEATIPAQAAARSDAGATWLAVLGNDAWFAGTYIAEGHFYQCRLRAVENRKDLLVNINQGYSGLIRASGAIAAQFEGDTPVVNTAGVQPNRREPFSHLPFIVAIVLLLLLTNRFIIKPKNTIA